MPRRALRPPLASGARWWLGGTETCPHCLQGYAVEVEYRCVACDHGICPGCVVVVRERRVRYLCPSCSEAGDEEGGA